MPNTIKEEVSRLKELMHLKEGCGGDVVVTNEPNHVEENHKGSYMAKQQLYNIAKKAQSVHDRIDNGETLDDWMESKIAQMADNMDSVSNSFDYDEHEDHHNNETPLSEDVMYGVQDGYADDSDGDNDYTFDSKGALGSEPELEGEGFTEPETNHPKEKQAYNFDSQGPTDDFGDQLSYELGEQEDGTGTGESEDGAGAGTAAMGLWDSGVARGIANQISNSKWSDSYQPSRGKANPLV